MPAALAGVAGEPLGLKGSRAPTPDDGDRLHVSNGRLPGRAVPGGPVRHVVRRNTSATAPSGADDPCRVPPASPGLVRPMSGAPSGPNSAPPTRPASSASLSAAAAAALGQAPSSDEIGVAAIAGLGGLAPLRCRVALDCAEALAGSPRLPHADADPWSAQRAAGALVLVFLCVLGLRYATPDNLMYVVSVMRENPDASMALYLVVYTIGVVAMLPGMLFSLAAGAAFGFARGAVVSFVATSTGMILAFLLGRYLFHDAVASLLLKRVPNFAAIDRGVAEEGWKLVLLLRLSPLMPYNVLNYIMGATSIRLLPYAVPSAAAALLYSCLFSYVGAAADDVFKLLHGGASASLGAAWVAAGAGAALVSAYGLVRVCQRLFSAGGDAAAARKDYLPVEQCDEDAAAAEAGGAGGGCGGAVVGIPGAGGKEEGALGGCGWVQMVDAAGGGGSVGGGTAVAAGALLGGHRRISVGVGG